MKKLLLLLLTIKLFTSCEPKPKFNEVNRFYKNTENQTYVTFINDTIAAINSDSLSSCKWTFMKFQSNKDDLYKTNELKTDTMWFRSKEKKIEFNAGEETIIFEEVTLEEATNIKVKKDIEIFHIFENKGVSFDCEEYTIKEIGDFYERAINKTKSRLKNPSSAKFNKVKIEKYRTFNKDYDYKKTTTTVVSVNTESKNGFGNFSETVYYVFFIPNEYDNTRYDLEFSKSSSLDYDTRDNLQFE